MNLPLALDPALAADTRAAALRAPRTPGSVVTRRTPRGAAYRAQAFAGAVIAQQAAFADWSSDARRQHATLLAARLSREDEFADKRHQSVEDADIDAKGGIGDGGTAVFGSLTGGGGLERRGERRCRVGEDAGCAVGERGGSEFGRLRLCGRRRGGARMGGMLGKSYGRASDDGRRG